MKVQLVKGLFVEQIWSINMSNIADEKDYYPNILWTRSSPTNEYKIKIKSKKIEIED